MYINLIIYFFGSFVIIFFSTFFSYKLSLVDKPTKRKIHSKPVAFTGGLALSLAYLFSIHLFDFHYQNLNYIITIGFLIALVGLLDDIKDLNTGGKLSLQVIPIFYLIIFENLYLTDIGHYEYFTIFLGSFSVPFTCLSILLLINSFNYSDGIDGALGLLTISTLIILFILTDDNNIKVLITALIIPLIIFLIFNFAFFNFQKLFLGDSGSLFLGFIISFFLIYFANQKIAHPIILAWSVVLIVYEFLSINIIRIINKKNLFIAGKDHLHHLILKKYKSVFFTNFLITSINITLFFVGYLSFKLINPLFSLMSFVIFFMIFFILRIKRINEK